MASVPATKHNAIVPSMRGRNFLKIKRYLPLYILFLPVLVYYLIFAYAPMAGVIIAFKNYNFIDGIWGSSWAGVEHFVRFWNSSEFWNVMYNTLILAVYRTIFGFPAPIIFAILIYELRFTRFTKFIQTVSYLPHFISWVVVYAVVYNFFSSGGLINQILGEFGKDSISFMGDSKYFRALFTGSAMWKEIGWNAIIYLAALTRVDTDLYEAASIDGANRWHRLWHITLPGIRSIVSIMFVLSLGNILSVSFEQVLVMINPMVTDVAEVLDYYIYRIGLLDINNQSYATAIGVFRSLLALLLVIISNVVAKKLDEDGGIW
ncbi:putative multiple-sugar transport system permease YteP [compost metagenome]